MINLLSVKIKIRNLRVTTTLLCILALTIASVSLKAAFLLLLVTAVLYAIKKNRILQAAFPKEDYVQLKEQLGMGEDDLVICDWKQYPDDYDKSWAQVITKQGKFIEKWNWLNADLIGEVPVGAVAYIRYAEWKDL